MKVLILAPQPFFQDRGTPIAVRMLAEDLQGGGNEVDLLVFHEGEDVDISPASLYRTTKIPGIKNIGPGFSLKKIICDFLMMLKAIRLCAKKRYDVVHAVEEAVFIAIILKLLYKIPYVYDVDSWMSDQLIDKMGFLRIFRPIFNYFERKAVNCSDGVVAVCLALEEKIKKINPKIPLLRLEDVCLLEDEVENYEDLRELIQSDGEIFLYVGNLESYQGIDLLLESFRLFSINHLTSNLVVIGGRVEDIQKYQKKCEEYGVASRVFFIGPRPLKQLGMYLRQADVLVSPRVDGENTPMKVYSYMGSGTVILATNIKSHTQVLNETNSFLAPPVAKEMVTVMADIFARPAESKTRADQALKLVEERFSRSAFRKKITEFYTELANVWNMRI